MWWRVLPNPFLSAPCHSIGEFTFHQQNGRCEAITQLPTLQSLSFTPVVCIWVGTWSGWSISQYMPLDKSRIGWAQEEFKLVRLSHCSSWSVEAASFSRNVTRDLWVGSCDRQRQQRMLLFSRSVVSDPLRPRGLQHARLPCLSPSLGACSNSCLLSQWCQPTISYCVVPFSCLRSFPGSGSFPTSRGWETLNITWYVQFGSDRLTPPVSSKILDETFLPTPPHPLCIHFI